MPKSLFCLVVFLLSGGTAAAQYPDDEYYPYAEREERRELLVTDSTLFYRAVQSAADLYGEQTDFNLPQVAFKRRGLERRAGRISFAGMDLSYRYLPALRLLGAEAVPVTSGTGTLKDACSAAFREWTNRISDTHYCIGSVMGPHPFPTMVRDFQAVISKEIKEQLLEKEGKLPDAVIACVGGGSNAIGAFYHFINDPSVRLIGCEAAGRGVDTAETSATIATGRPGIFHGMKSYFCQD